MNKLIILLLSVLVLGVFCAEEDYWYGNQESECVSQGGSCIAQTQCAEPIGRPGELCPQQAALGFQCCQGLPVNERRCSFRGGECFKKKFCNQRVVYSQASDCAADQECCILV